MMEMEMEMEEVTGNHLGGAGRSPARKKVSIPV